MIKELEHVTCSDLPATLPFCVNKDMTSCFLYTICGTYIDREHSYMCHMSEYLLYHNLINDLAGLEL